MNIVFIKSELKYKFRQSNFLDKTLSNNFNF